jgi:predicted O-methyltransferase YrrM
MINQTYADICTPELLAGAIENNEYTGFKEDYHVLWCLLKKYNPASVFEIGTNMGTGTNIICHALPDAKVYSLDLPTELAHISLQHPVSEGKGDAVGSKCKKPFTQLRGDSMMFNYKDYPVEAAFIDGEHDYDHVFKETVGIAAHLNDIKLIIWHDADMPEVAEGIEHAIAYANSVRAGFELPNRFELYRVTDTRIAYAVKQ